MMQLTYSAAEFSNTAGLEVRDTLRIPLANFITASLISLGLWSVIGWTAWFVIG